MATIKLFMNRDTGEIMTRDQAKAEWREQYDGDDPTNMFCWGDQYAEIDTGTDPGELFKDVTDAGSIARMIDAIFTSERGE